MTGQKTLTLRPYQLINVICELGSGKVSEKSSQILAVVRETPDLPVTLVCNASDVYTYQNPGTADDTPEGPEFNISRDLEILYRLNMYPGGTLPARVLFNRVLERIDNLTGICVFETVTSQAWQGCPQECNERYKKGREMGIEAIIPSRPEEDLAQEKEASIKAMHEAEAIRVRPHMLLCSVCQYGNGVRPPFPEDNLPEMLQLVLREPETLIEMARCAEWMMCGPCPSRSPKINACVNNKGSGGLANQMRDLRVLQKLGLEYGDRINARDLYQRIFERISGTLEICGIDLEKPSVWWTGCGSAKTNSESYEKGKKMLMKELGIGGP